MKTIYYFICLFLISSSLLAQPGVPQIGMSRDTTLPCGQSCVDISARYLYTGSTSTYDVQRIPYLPLPYNTGNPILVGIDDTWSSIIRLPFRFCFFGIVYDSVIVGSNGDMSFNTANANGFNSWTISGAVPANTPSDVYNSILGVWQDQDPTHRGLLHSEIAGVYPYRYYKISWDSIPYYGDQNSLSPTTCPTPKFASSQIILYETTNMIDIYIKNKDICTAWNGGLAVEGIVNAANTVAYTVPGRNATQWTASDDAWRFTPNGPGNLVSVKLMQGGVVIDSAYGDSSQTLTRHICPPSSATGPLTTTYYASVTYDFCSGGNVTLFDSLHVTVLNGGAGTDKTICPTTTTTLDGTGTGSWTAMPSNPSATVISNPSSASTPVSGFDSIGEYKFVYCSSSCCDTMSIFVTSQLLSNTYAQICGSQTYTFRGVTYSAIGTYSDTVHGSSTCDSVYVLHLSTAPGVNTYLVETICFGTAFVFNGQSLNQAGTYIDTLHTVSGCDSIVTLDLLVSPANINNITASVCSSQPYIFGADTLTATGVYRDTATSSSGCDSITVLDLTVSNVITQSISASICTGTSYTFGGLMYTVGGVYSDSTTSSYGCDSITTLTLTVLSGTLDSVSATICLGTSYYVGANSYNTAGTYIDTITSAGGCDSIVVTTLTIDTPAAASIVSQGDTLIAYPQGAGAYLWNLNGNPIYTAVSDTFITTVAGSYTVSVGSSYACYTTSPPHVIAGVDQLSQNLVRLYPNPNTGSFTLETSGLRGMDYIVYDMIGQVVMHHTVTSDKQAISLNNVAEGVYSLLIDGRAFRFVVSK